MTGPDGVHVALMGIDGAGKSTLAVRLAEALRTGGREVEIVSFKRAMLGGARTVSDVLSHVAFAALTCQYADAVPRDPAVDLGVLFGPDDLGTGFPAAERRLREVPVASNGPRPFLSGALLEMVGGLWVQTHVEARLRAGVSVIDESFAFKHALKNVLFAQRMSEPGSEDSEQAGRLLDAAMSLFGGLLRPAFGYWVDTDPELATRWRAAAGEETTPFESFALAGEDGEASFGPMQRACRAAFGDAARRWGWSRLEMRDRPSSENVAEAVRCIEKDVSG